MESEADISSCGKVTDYMWNREMLFIFILVRRMPISLCRIGLQRHLHTAAYSNLRLPLLISFLSGVNGVQGGAYHMRRSVQLNNVSKSDLEDKLYHGERSR